MSIKYDKILIVQYNLLGDVICSTGIVRAVREQFPNSKIAFLVSPETKDLVNLPFVDELVIYDKGMPILPVIKQIWRYDVALLLDFKYRSAFLPFLAMIPVRAGLRHKRGLFMTHGIDLPDYNYKYYITEYMAKILEDAVGLKLTADVTRLTVADATESDISAVNNLLSPLHKDKKFVAVAPFASNPVKNWNAERYYEFMTKLSDEYDFVVIGGNDDADKLFKIPENTLDLRGKASMTESAEILRRASYLVCGCSAPLHLAVAVKTPILALYGSTSRTKWVPKRGAICIQHNFSCSPCDRWYGRDCNNDAPCMKAITVDEVVDGFKELVKLYPNGVIEE